MGIVVKTKSGNYVKSDPGEGLIQNQAQVLDLLVLCGEAGSNKVLISEGSLDPEFFDLSTGLAGEITLKLSTYRVKTAIIVDIETIPSERFKEWVYECNRGKEIRFFKDYLNAEHWLLDK